mgnify:FL=1
MDGSFEVFQIAATNDHLLALLYNDEPEIEPEQTPQFVPWNVLENYHEMDWADTETDNNSIDSEQENDRLREENNVLTADLERSHMALELLQAKILVDKESHETMQDMLAGQLEDALHTVDLMTENSQYYQRMYEEEQAKTQMLQIDNTQCDTAMGAMRKEIIEVQLKVMQLELLHRTTDTEIYTLKMDALKQTL